MFLLVGLTVPFSTTPNTLSPCHTQQRESLRCSLEYFSERKHIAEFTMKVRHETTETILVLKGTECVSGCMLDVNLKF